MRRLFRMVAEGVVAKVIPTFRVLKRAWMELVLVGVLAVSGFIVVRLHGIFAAADPSANAVGGVEIVAFNPKVVTYEIFGAAGSTASIN